MAIQPTVETVSTGADKAKLAGAAVLALGSIALFYVLGKQDLWLRIVALLLERDSVFVDYVRWLVQLLAGYRIEADDSVIKATVIYPSTQAADGIALARLVAQEKTMSDLVTPSVPYRIVLDAPVVTKDNVADYIDLAFES